MKKDRKSPAKKPRATRKILISKTEIAAILDDMANLLELTDANVFKIRAFSNAARELENLPGDLAEMVASGNLLEVQGIGKGIFSHIEEILETGTFAEFEELRAKFPPGLLGMLRIPGVGPKKVKTLHEELKKALAQIRTLQGIIPICMHCHKIRSDEEAWDRMEAYVEKHSESQFSHSICPDCLEKYHGEKAAAFEQE